MMLRIAIVALITSAVAALKNLTPNGEISANSALGMRLLRQAQVVTPARQLNDNENNRDVTFIAGYSIRYMGCHSIISVGAGNQNNNNKNDGDLSMLTLTHLARFALCPTSSCGSNKCEGGGEYVMNMETFVDAFTEARLTAEEYACETVRENCVCNGDDEDACEATCYTNANLSYCTEEEGEDFDVQKLLECQSTCRCVIALLQHRFVQCILSHN
jgi:hypothetical protein